jgi:hypothetical protein
MSFQTFCGNDPDDAVSYQKVLPQFLPENSASASVIRILQAGGTNIAPPSVQNEALTIIDLVPPNGGNFSVNILPNPPTPNNETLIINGQIPFATANEEGYLCYGSLDYGGLNQRGCIYKFIPNNANPSLGVWTLRAITTQVSNPAGTSVVISGGCQLDPTTANGGRPVAGADYIFAGGFVAITDPDGTNQVNSTNFIQYDADTDTFSAVPIAAGVFTSNMNSTELVGLPATLIGIGTFIIWSPSGTFQRGATDFTSIIVYSPAGGGTIKRVFPNAIDGADEINAVALDSLNRLWLGGVFAFITFNGNQVPCQGIACIETAGGGSTSFDTFVQLPYQLQRADFVNGFKNSFDGTKFTICGSYSTITKGGVKITNFCYVDVANGTTLDIFIPTGSSVPSGAPCGLSLMIDENTYVVSYQETYGINLLFGLDAGTSASFAKGLVSIFQNTLNWYWEGIDAGNPLSYINFDYFADNPFNPPTRTAFSGSFLGGGASTINFTGGATCRYVKASGEAGDATSISIQSAYSSVSLIGDKTANAWDVVGTQGTLTFSP